MKKLILALAFIGSAQAQTNTAPIVVAQPSSTPYTVWTSSGSYVVVPNYTTGQPQAVIQVSKPATTTTSTAKSTGGKK
jgi:hypothetical protein